MKNNIFIQSRLGSTRLPKKALKKICGKTIIELILERIKNVENVNEIILVTGKENMNKELVDEANRLEIQSFCGSEENILDRFYFASKKFPSNNIIRILADCPLIDFNLISKGLKIFESNKYDILSMARKRTFPHGLDFEIFKTTSLVRSWKNMIKELKTKDKIENTFINPIKYMLENNAFKKYDLINEKDLSKLRFTLDYPEDYELVKKIYEELYQKNYKFTLKEILHLLQDKPNLLEINKKHNIF
jgi:spore coat polysaccharide biosynthesis protein SpsF